MNQSPGTSHIGQMTKNRCAWCGTDPLYVNYHDTEWGVPLHDDRKLFEVLSLGGAQAGLSWLTILRKRGSYRAAFETFDPEKVARYLDRDVRRLLADPGIVRNRLKIEATIKNAKGVLLIQEEFGSFDSFLWRYVYGLPRKNIWRLMTEVPASTPLSDTLSKELKRRGFRFVGSTICYAFMQAAGMINDHVVTCFRHDEVKPIGALIP